MKFVDRDISWLSFNRRVSDETKKDTNSFGDKVMFHGITFSNLDEFLMVRYPAAGPGREDLVRAVREHYDLLTSRFHAFNKKEELIRRVKDLPKDQQKWSEKYFRQNVFPALLPVTADPARQPHIRAGMYILTVTEDSDENESVGYIEIPPGLDRFIPVPEKHYVIAIEDLIRENIKSVIRNRKIIQTAPFSVLRSAEVYTQPAGTMDPFRLIEATLHERERSWITKLEVGTEKKTVLRALRKLIPLDQNTIILQSDMVQLADLKKFPQEVYKDSEKPTKLKPAATFPSSGIFDYIKQRDRLCFHPYESYEDSVVRFLEEASTDPDVVSIRICLYRVADHSRIISALLKAADSGKSVTVLVELKARFDEKHNMQISRILREGGVTLVYTKPDIKTHAKVCLVTRQEKKGLRIYSHIGTGNYSEANSKAYTDYSYFTADQEIGTDLTQFFNLLTSEQDEFKSRKIIYAPYNLRSTIVSEISHQMKRAKEKKTSRIVIKCNGLTDEKVAERLVEAADDGVEVILIIRSACIIQPQKNISICSIVGQQLEHSRIYVFGTGKNSRVYIGSSDLMTRNLSSRNELLLLVEPYDLKQRILGHVAMYLTDTVNRRKILKGGKYEEVKPGKGEKPFNCQAAFMKEAKKLV